MSQETAVRHRSATPNAVAAPAMIPSMPVAFIDTETLGLDPDHHKIWEIAVIVDGVEHCWQQTLTLTDLRAADPYAVELTRFNVRYDPGAALSPADSLERLAGLVEGRHWVGAVPSFDEERVRRAWMLHGRTAPDRWPWHYHLIDVEALAVGYLIGGHYGPGIVDLPWDSNELSRSCNVEPPTGDDRHTALADARWAKALYEHIIG